MFGMLPSMKLLPPTAAAAGALLAAALVIVAPACAAPARAHTVTLQISGGHDTDPADHGRPVVLVAAGLGVPTEVFRTAFSGVHPAAAGSGGPTEREAQANKAALMSVLAPYAVTNERLDEVSNYYRYMASDGELWRHASARATAVVRDGKVVSVRLLDGGAGYSSTPKVTVLGAASASIKATVSYGTDLATNGAITRLTVVRAG
jgi:hypothetical protein